MTKKIVILHGWWGKPDSHWFWWLKQQWEKKWYEVLVPQLTNTEYPILWEQMADIEDILLSPWDLIIGHSLGCQLALQWIEQRKLTWVRVILVAPTYHNLADELWSELLGDAFVCLFNYYDAPNNFKQLNRLENSFTLLLSDNDPYINQFSAREYYSSINNVHTILCNGKWHFNTDVGVIEFPEILVYLH